MKKLFLSLLLLSISSTKLCAQKYSLSISTGPSAIYYLTDDINQNGSKSPIGLGFGVDLARKIHSQWQINLDFRYCLWKTPNLVGPLQWPSENNNGAYQYDPTIAHYLVKDYSQRSAFQLLTGIQWQSKLEVFHWVAIGEFGVTGFTKNEAGISTRLYPTVGLSIGAEYLVRSNLFLFAHPGVRAIFRDSDRRNTNESHVLNLLAELGVRYAF